MHVLYEHTWTSLWCRPNSSCQEISHLHVCVFTVKQDRSRWGHYYEGTWPRWETSTLEKSYSNGLNSYSEHLHMSARPVKKARDNTIFSAAKISNVSLLCSHIGNIYIWARDHLRILTTKWYFLLLSFTCFSSLQMTWVISCVSVCWASSTRSGSSPASSPSPTPHSGRPSGRCAWTGDTGQV